MISLQSVWIIRRIFERILDAVDLIAKSLRFLDELWRVSDNSLEQLPIPLNEWKGAKRLVPVVGGGSTQ